MKVDIFKQHKEFYRRADEDKRPVEWHQFSDGRVCYVFDGNIFGVDRNGRYLKDGIDTFDLLPLVAPEYVPWSCPDDVPEDARWIRCTKLRSIFSITGIGNDGVRIGGHWCTWDDLFASHQWSATRGPSAVWHVCGKVKE